MGNVILGILLLWTAIIASLTAIGWGLAGTTAGWPLKVTSTYTLYGRKARMGYLAGVLGGAVIVVELCIWSGLFGTP
jgi:hypothetical protein